MSQIYNLYKPIGVTPLELLRQLQQTAPNLSGQKLTYIGRLDPLAHGVQLIMAQPTHQQVQKYKGLSKTYQCTLALGVATDSYDVMGLISQTHYKLASQIKPSLIQTTLLSYLGKSQQTYPPFSAVKIKGKAAFEYAKQNQLKEVNLPSKPVEIFSITDIKISQIALGTLAQTAYERVQKVRGDFRQEQILPQWQQLISEKHQFIPAIECKITCSSGTYIRSLCHQLGLDLHTGAVCIDLLRTTVGSFKLEDSQKIDDET